jgi:hypothetical protein
MVPVTVLLQSGVRSSNLGTGRDSRVHLEASIRLGGVLKRNAVILDAFFGMIRAILDHRLFEFRPRDVKGRELDHNSASDKTYVEYRFSCCERPFSWTRSQRTLI